MNAIDRRIARATHARDVRDLAAALDSLIEHGAELTKLQFATSLRNARLAYEELIKDLQGASFKSAVTMGEYGITTGKPAPVVYP
jgi:hypothetical protein